MIGILDYGLGNVGAFYNIYKRLNIPVCIVTDAEKIDSIDRLILPGVGSFDWAMNRLSSSGMLEELNKAVLDREIPILGVCVGMQMMAQGSDEGHLKGLGWIDASVRHFSKLTNEKIDLPHMGWNDIQVYKEHPLFKNLEKDAIFYFYTLIIFKRDPILKLCPELIMVKYLHHLYLKVIFLACNFIQKKATIGVCSC